MTKASRWERLMWRRPLWMVTASYWLRPYDSMLDASAVQCVAADHDAAICDQANPMRPPVIWTPEGYR